MVDRINDIAWQAHQGSVAAIIQVLNDRLANSGVRTRAIFDNGVLQLLCEAHSQDNLEQSILVKQIQQILESIQPRNIRRVNINSRIVREQQLLWLEEIHRDSEQQLLWTQEITLIQPNIVKRLFKDLSERKMALEMSPFPKPRASTFSITKPNNFQSQRLWETAKICGFLLLFCIILYTMLGGKLKNPMQQLVTPNHKAATPSQDTFAEAVRIANSASEAGKVAKTSAQWLDIAARWQRASELMNAVPPSHSRYEEAQIRTKLYKKYSEAAEQEAKKSPSTRSSLASVEWVT
ncbi:hypothetical protein G7B40_009415 [Aetokthonos hydrillicola Thurmond2011]|jgi:hypothetical protein|uniref:Uncharacterized protein n=1 Tax=Aetokthonos hydrillicola Thurmond2011 TaxID=2712845 RepID=A0AAP5M762_9CYAN|nr:hypothetical protein [Aetokthonos hydrillicola]MBO3457534.1 hypothetical protein [Aetokthonos hydrillicola CCALA 1050]MBW4590744.1 hypothetical protein [Aetokthonos hydrillicola CCALA 1050]MDR9894785.1 hypothetical protein [Aetokthonos hydrillicola Thurmond2011]